MNRTAPPTGQPSSSQPVGSQNIPGPSMDVQHQMVQKFSEQSGMNIEYSKLFVFNLFLLNIYIFNMIYL